MKEAIKQILLLILAAAVGFFLNEYTTQRQSRMMYIDYHLEATPDVFNRFSSPSPQITVSAGGTDVARVSQLEIVFDNPGDGDFEDVPIFVDLVGGSNASFEVIGRSTVGDFGLAEGVSDFAMRAVASNPTTVRCSFTLKTVNRLASPADRPRVTLLVSGAVLPGVRVTTSKKGLTIRAYDAERYKTSNAVLAILVSLVYVGLGASMIWLIRWSSAREDLRNFRSIVPRVKEALQANRERLAMSDEDAVRLGCLEIFLANRPEELQVSLQAMSEYLREHVGDFENAPDPVLEGIAARLVRLDFDDRWKARRGMARVMYPRARLPGEGRDRD